MKKVLCRIAWAILLLFAAVEHTSADSKKDYKEFADATRKRIWAMDMPQFKKHDCPAKYKTESAIILANYRDVEMVRSAKFSWGTLMRQGQSFKLRKLYCNDLHRVLIYINDDVALKRFSEFDYRTTTTGYSNNGWREKGKVVLGVRIVKPDGTIKEISTDDYVSATEGKKDKQERQKLAVPGLEVGDAIDVFIYESDEFAEHNYDPFFFKFKEDYPVLWNRLHCDIDKDFTVLYRSLNGAPKVTESTDKEGNYVLDAEMLNQEKCTPSLWYDETLQTPGILLAAICKVEGELRPDCAKKKGITANPDPKLIQRDVWRLIGIRYPVYKYGDFPELKKLAKQAKKDIPDETKRADYIYDLVYFYHLKYWFNYYRDTRVALQYYTLLKDAGIPAVFGITTDDNEADIDKLTYWLHTRWFVKLRNSEKYYFGYGPVSVVPGEIPSEFQGKKAILSIDEKKPFEDGKYQTITLPVSKASDNRDVADIRVTLNGTEVTIDRTESQSGALKELWQTDLCTPDNLFDSYKQRMKEDKDLATTLGKRATRSREASLEEVRKQQIDDFKKEIKYYQGEDAKELLSYKIVTIGNSPDSAAFVYNMRYTLDGLVKKAGSNIVLSVGKLIGDVQKIEGNDRKRDADINRMCARQTEWNIAVDLPAGYKVSAEGLQKLNTNVQNAAGAFMATAKSEGGKLLLHVVKRYDHKNEPVANWQALLDIVDACYAYTARQVVLKK